MADHRSTDRYTQEDFERATTPGGSWRHPEQPLPRIGDYTLLRELGRGSYGVVYQAKRDGLERYFAIKVLLSNDAEVIARFHVEARAAGKITDPGIVGVVDVGYTGERPYYVMEYCEGENLEQRLRHGPLLEQEAAELVRDLARTLAKVHARGVIHRDLKPENILLEESTGRARITDFGLARDFSVAGLTRSGDTVGTPYYMAPEQLHNTKNVDARSDVYALGVIFYRCLTGELPFPGATITEVYERIKRGSFKRPRQVLPTLSAEVESICLAAMDGDVGSRTQSCADFADSLDAYLGGSTLGSGWQRPASGWLTGVAIGLTALLIGTAVALALHHRAQSVRLAEARTQLSVAKSKRAAGDDPTGPLERAERLAKGDEELEAEVAALREAVTVDASLTELGELLRAGGPLERVETILASAPGDALETSARALAEEALGRARREFLSSRAEAARFEPLVGSLQVAERLAGGDEDLARSLKVARHLVQARLAGADLRRARELVDEARREGKRLRDLQPLLTAESRRVEGRERLDDARRQAFQLGEAESVLRRLDRALALAEGDPALEAEVILERVQILYRRGRYREAAREAERFSEIDGRAPRLGRLLAGLSLYRVGREEEARSTLEALGKGSDAVAALALCNLGLVFKERPQDAVGHAQRALELDPSLIDAQVSLALATAVQDAARGREIVVEALQKAPDHPRAHCTLGLVQEHARDLVGANESFSRAIALTGGKMASALAFRARISLERGQAERALQDLQEALNLKKRAGFLVLSGRAKFALGRAAEARKDWLEVMALEPELLRAEAAGASSPELRAAINEAISGGGASVGSDVLELARTWLDRQPPLEEALAKLQGSLAQVEHLYRRGRFAGVVERTERIEGGGREEQLRLLEMRAYALFFVGRARECVSLLEQIYRSDRQGRVGLASGGAYNVFRGRMNEADRLLRDAIRLDPQDPEAYIDQGFLYMGSRASRALDVVEKALRLRPGMARGLYCYRSVCIVLNDLPRALAAAELLTRMSGNVESFARDQANLAMRVNDPEAHRRAIAALDKSIERHPPKQRERLQAVALLRGLLYHRLGQTEEAVADWRAAQRANPQQFEQLVQGLDPTSLEAVRAGLKRE